MPEFDVPAKSFTVTSIKRKGFTEAGFAMSSGVITLLERLIWVPRLGTVTPLEFDVSYGLNANVTAALRMQWFLVMVDVDNLPSLEAVAERSIWNSFQHYQFYSSVGILQSMDRDLADFFNPSSFSYTEVANFTTRSAIALVAEEGGTKSINFSGVIVWQEVLIQRVFGGDSATFDESDQGWIDDFADEEEGDYD